MGPSNALWARLVIHVCDSPRTTIAMCRQVSRTFLMCCQQTSLFLMRPASGFWSELLSRCLAEFPESTTRCLSPHKHLPNSLELVFTSPETAFRPPFCSAGARGSILRKECRQGNVYVFYCLSFSQLGGCRPTTKNCRDFQAAFYFMTRGVRYVPSCRSASCPLGIL